MQAEDSVIKLIGHTPAVRLTHVARDTLVAKLEYLNSTGSLKGRIALRRIEAAEPAAPSSLLSGKRLVEWLTQSICKSSSLLPFVAACIKVG